MKIRRVQQSIAGVQPGGLSEKRTMCSRPPWRDVGAALLLARQWADCGEHYDCTSADVYAAWCEGQGFGSMYPSLRTAAERYGLAPDEGIPQAIVDWYAAGRPLRPITPFVWLPPQEMALPNAHEAWAQIKATGTEDPQVWRKVGEALRIGQHLYGLGAMFGQWCDEHGFADMDAERCEAAMRLAPTVCDPGKCPLRPERGCDQALEMLHERPFSDGRSREFRKYIGQGAVTWGVPELGATSNVQDPLSPDEILSVPEGVPNMQDAVGLLLEAAANMQRGVDLMREVAQIIQQSATPRVPADRS